MLSTGLGRIDFKHQSSVEHIPACHVATHLLPCMRIKIRRHASEVGGIYYHVFLISDVATTFLGTTI